MFFSGKKGDKTKVIDRVFISSAAKQTALVQLVREKAGAVLITWFDESYEAAQALFRAEALSADIFDAKQVAAHDVQSKAVIFPEHYPLAEKEQALISQLQLKTVYFYSALDEALFHYFGGDRIIAMMEKMGMSENEGIEHPFITNAIRNAQEKIAEKVRFEQSARSQSGWFAKNLPPH